MNETLAVEFGKPGSLHHRILFLDSKTHKEVSPWHDLPLHRNSSEEFVNFVCTTPRGHWGHFETAAFEPHTPLRLSQAVGPPANRPCHYIENCSSWEIGFLPQTWSTSGSDAIDLLQGTNVHNGSNLYPKDAPSPMEAIVVGSKSSSKTGNLYEVKVLGVFTVTDSTGKMGWKVLGVAAEESGSPAYQNLQDFVLLYQENVLKALCSWLETCHCDVANGVKPSVVGNGGRPMGADWALNIISESHQNWRFLHRKLRVLVGPSLPHPVNLSPRTPQEYEALWAPLLAQDKKRKEEVKDEAEKADKEEELWVIPLQRPTVEAEFHLEKAWECIEFGDSASELSSEQLESPTPSLTSSSSSRSLPTRGSKAQHPKPPKTPKSSKKSSSPLGKISTLMRHLSGIPKTKTLKVPQNLRFSMSGSFSGERSLSTPCQSMSLKQHGRTESLPNALAGWKPEKKEVEGREDGGGGRKARSSIFSSGSGRVTNYHGGLLMQGGRSGLVGLLKNGRSQSQPLQASTDRVGVSGFSDFEMQGQLEGRGRVQERVHKWRRNSFAAGDVSKDGSEQPLTVPERSTGACSPREEAEEDLYPQLKLPQECMRSFQEGSTRLQWQELKMQKNLTIAARQKNMLNYQGSSEMPTSLSWLDDMGACPTREGLENDLYLDLGNKSDHIMVPNSMNRANQKGSMQVQYKNEFNALRNSGKAQRARHSSLDSRPTLYPVSNSPSGILRGSSSRFQNLSLDVTCMLKLPEDSASDFASSPESLSSPSISRTFYPPSPNLERCQSLQNSTRCKYSPKVLPTSASLGSPLSKLGSPFSTDWNQFSPRLSNGGTPRITRTRSLADRLKEAKKELGNKVDNTGVTVGAKG